MSLRTFHLLFIALSVLLSAFSAAWAGQEYRMEREWVYALVSAGALLFGAALVVYGATFQIKTRRL